MIRGYLVSIPKINKQFRNRVFSEFCGFNVIWQNRDQLHITLGKFIDLLWRKFEADVVHSRGYIFARQLLGMAFFDDRVDNVTVRQLDRYCSFNADKFWQPFAYLRIGCQFNK